MDWLLAADRWHPAVTLELRLRPEVATEAVEAGLVVRHPWGTVLIAGATAGVSSWIEGLMSGWVHAPWSAATTSHQAPGDLAELFWAIDRLGFLVQVRLTSDEGALMTAEPMSAAARLPVQSDRPHQSISRFAFLRSEHGEPVLESPVSAHRVRLHGAAAISVIATLLCGHEPPHDHVGAAALSLLAGVGMLEGTEGQAGSGYDESVLRMAELPDLLVHQHSRFGTHDGEFGATFPFLGAIEPSSVVRAIDPGPLVQLPTPPIGEVRERDPLLTDAIEARCSVREFGQHALTLSELGEFLFRCARLRGRYGPIPEAGMPYEAGDRPFPSGGGLHELELYPVVANVRDLEDGIYRYVPDRHALQRVPAAESDIQAVLAAAVVASSATRPPPVLLKITARLERMAWKYRAMGYTTVLKNVGVLYQTMYLVASAMGLAACALGSGDEAAGARLLGAAGTCELGVGEFMLGHPSAGAEERVAAHRRGHPTWQDAVLPDWAD